MTNMTMLSPHELATLMLLNSAPDQVEMTRTELDTLLDSRLVSLSESLTDSLPDSRDVDAGRRRRLTLTPAGVHVLQAAARIESVRPRDETRRRDDNRVWV
jgi:hypothetical protein